VKIIEKTYVIDADAERVFNSLTSTEHICIWTKEKADMDVNENGKFSLWGGNIIGNNLSVKPDKIVQKWKFKDWSDYSDVEMEIIGVGNKTEIKLIHKNIPEKEFDSVDKGWDEMYLGPLKDYCEI
jgi:activator of HSP90 ATPase